MTSTRERQGLVIAFLGVVGFSFSLPWTVWALESFSPVFTATGRAVIAGGLAIVVLASRRVPWPRRDQVKPILYTMAGAVFGWPILIALALERTTAAHAAVIAAVMPLVTAEKLMNSAFVFSAMIRASVVFPTPGGPQKIMEEMRSCSISLRSTLPGPVTCVCPAKSSSVFGRRRSARGLLSSIS